VQYTHKVTVISYKHTLTLPLFIAIEYHYITT